MIWTQLKLFELHTFACWEKSKAISPSMPLSPIQLFRCSSLFFSGVARFTVCCSSMHRHSMHALINTTLYVIIVCLCRWSQCFFASIRFEQTRIYFIMQCCCSRPWQHFSIFVVFAAYSKIAIFPVFLCVCGWIYNVRFLTSGSTLNLSSVSLNYNQNCVQWIQVLW